MADRIVYIDKAEATFNAVTAWTITLPATAQVGDLAIVFAGQVVGTGTFSPPAADGWTTAQAVEAGSDCTMAYSYKVLVAGDPGAAKAFTWSTTKTGSELAVIYRGVDKVTPVESATFLTQASASTWTTSAIVPTVNDCMIVGACTGDDNSGYTDPQYTPPTTPSNWTERSDFRDPTAFETLTEAEFLQGTAASISGNFGRANADIGMSLIMAVRPGYIPFRTPYPQLLPH